MEVEGEPYDGFEVYAFLLPPEESARATWVWEKVVPHPLDLIIEDRVMGEIGIDEWQGKLRNRVKKLMPRVG
jgi:hypothetical protein